MGEETRFLINTAARRFMRYRCFLDDRESSYDRSGVCTSPTRKTLAQPIPGVVRKMSRFQSSYVIFLLDQIIIPLGFSGGASGCKENNPGFSNFPSY